MGQEPGTNEEIQACTRTQHNVLFPILSKTKVNGSEVDEVFNFVKKELPGFLGTTSVKWNFTKFLIDKDGYGFKRYSPSVDPEACFADIEALLERPSDFDRSTVASSSGASKTVTVSSKTASNESEPNYLLL